LAAVGNGEITPGEGLLLAQIVETQQRLLAAQAEGQSRKELELKVQTMQAEIESLLGESNDTSVPASFSAAPAPPALPAPTPEGLQ